MQKVYDIRQITERIKMKKIKRGDIYYIRPNKVVTGSEQAGYRPGIIVSNNSNNCCSSVVEVAYFTRQEKTLLPTHVPIVNASNHSTALCEQIDTVSKHRLKTYIGHATEEEMEAIDVACAISLDLNDLERKVKQKIRRIRKQYQEKEAKLEQRIKELEEELKVQKGV